MHAARGLVLAAVEKDENLLKHMPAQLQADWDIKLAAMPQDA